MSTLDDLHERWRRNADYRGSVPEGGRILR